MLDENLVPNDCDEWMLISKTKEILSLEDFAFVKNNFQLHFVDNFVGHMYREQGAYKKCIENNPDFCKLATYLIARGDHPSCLYVALQYKAYKMMRQYAESNWEMFK